MIGPVDYGLNEEQKIFIRKKVQQLGSISVVKKLYYRNCPVDEYARHIACEIYPDHNNSSINHSTPTIKTSKFQSKNKYESYWEQSKDMKTEAISKNHSKQSSKLSYSSEKQPLEEKNNYDVSSTEKRKLDKEAYLAALERKKERDKQSGGIPEHEEGTLRSEWGTRDDHKKMRARDWGDMQKRRKE